MAGIPLETYEARIKIKGTSTTLTTVNVQANCSQNAKKLIEAQYGKGCVDGIVTKVRK